MRENDPILPTNTFGRAPWLFALLLLALLIALSFWLRHSFLQAERDQVERYFDTIIEHIEADLLKSAEQQMAIQSRMASRLAFDGPFDEAAWRSDARQLIGDHPYYRFLAVLDGDLSVRWSEDVGGDGPAPGQRFALGDELGERLARHPADMSEVWISAMHTDRQQPRLLLISPIAAGGEIINWLVATVDMEEGISSMLTGFYLRDVVLTGDFSGATFEIAEPAISPAIPARLSEFRRVIRFALGGESPDLEIDIALRAGRADELRGGMAGSVFIFGLSMSLMIALAGFLAMASAKQARAVDAANQDLKRQIRDRELAERELEFLLTHDALTQLPNREGMLRKLEFLVEQCPPDLCLAVMLIDLDQFKDINETLGHDIGDALLREVPARLRRELAESDVLGRFGGDEYMVMALRSHQDRIVRLADHLLQSMEEPFQVEQHQFFVTASMGVAFGKAEQENPGDLIRNADAAMFRAKQQGRNRHAVFSDDMFDQVEYRLNLSREIRAGISNGEFSLAYQPIVDLRTLEIQGVEALMRWKRADGSEVSPESFIRVAEETGLINRLTRFALARAMQDLASWQNSLGRMPCWVSVNISGAQFREPGIVEYLSELLHEWRIHPGALHLEITEEVLIENLARNRDVLGRIHRIGVPMVVDDFGVGYSSLAYIKNFPISRIKIDKGFVGGLEHDPDDRAITRTICDLAGELKLQTVAEGIEQAGQLEWLRSFGCDQGQGYLFSKAVASGDLLRMFEGPPPWSGPSCPVDCGAARG